MGNIFAGLLSIPLLSIMSHILAYIDPGTGSIILQALVAAVAGVTIVVKLYWRRLRKFLGLRQTVESDPSDEQTDNEE